VGVFDSHFGLQHILSRMQHWNSKRDHQYCQCQVRASSIVIRAIRAVVVPIFDDFVDPAQVIV
jgi:hypothetical protein